MAGIFGYTPSNVLGGLYLTPQTGNEAIWRKRLANQGSISKPRPTLGQRIEGGTVDALRKAGLSDRNAVRIGGKAFGAFNDLTPLGNVTGAEEGATQFERGLTRGDLAQAALGAGVFGLSVLPMPGAAKRVVGKVGGGMFGRIMRDESGAIRAWHGSPHDFDKFSLSKIGTGEGAQAYGHGLYFAENRDVAEEYQRKLAPTRIEFRGQPLDDPRKWWAAKDGLEAQGDWRTAKALDQLHSWGRQGYDTETSLRYLKNEHRNSPQMLEAIDRLSAQVAMSKDKGRLYEVNINAEPQDFLDWETPYRAQPEPVRNALEPLLQSRFGSPDNPYRVGTLTENPDGQKLFRELKSSGGNWVEDALRDNGVAGLRYLDQGSRVGGGTRNYVVFDDGLINILNKF